MKLKKTEAIVKKVMEISLALMVIGIIWVAADMAYQQSVAGVDPKIKGWLAGFAFFFVALSLLCVTLMCFFEVIHICMQAGMKRHGIWLVIVGIITVMVIGFLLFWEFDFMRNNTAIMVFSLSVTGFAMKAYHRIGNEAKKK